MKLMEGGSALVDGDGDPKLPAFLYDLDLTDGSITQGLFRGPLLLAVSVYSPHKVESCQPGSSRFTCTSSYRQPLRSARRLHQNGGTQRFTV